MQDALKVNTYGKGVSWAVWRDFCSIREGKPPLNFLIYCRVPEGWGLHQTASEPRRDMVR